MGYDTTKGDGGNETFLFSNAGFVRKKDARRFVDWSKDKNFYGRWMPERRGMTEGIDYSSANESIKASQKKLKKICENTPSKYPFKSPYSENKRKEE